MRLVLTASTHAQRKRLEAKIAAEKGQVRAAGACVYWVAVPRGLHPRRPNSQPRTPRSPPARAATQPRHTPACLPVCVCEQIERDAVELEAAAAARAADEQRQSAMARELHELKQVKGCVGGEII